MADRPQEAFDALPGLVRVVLAAPHPRHVLRCLAPHVHEERQTGQLVVQEPQFPVAAARQERDDVRTVLGELGTRPAGPWIRVGCEAGGAVVGRLGLEQQEEAARRDACPDVEEIDGLPVVLDGREVQPFLAAVERVFLGVRGQIDQDVLVKP